MLGLWASGFQARRSDASHVAFARLRSTTSSRHRGRCESAGIVRATSTGQPTDEPVVLVWMPAASIFFRDPDGHLLEYIAMLPDNPRPDVGVLTWRDWTPPSPIRPKRSDESFVARRAALNFRGLADRREVQTGRCPIQDYTGSRHGSPAGVH